MKNIIIGDTVRLTWISSDVTPSNIYAHILTGSETSISSETMSNSGNGHYFLDVTLPDTAGYYVAEMVATVNGNPYKRRVKFKAVTGEVD